MLLKQEEDISQISLQRRIRIHISLLRILHRLRIIGSLVYVMDMVLMDILLVITSRNFYHKILNLLTSWLLKTRLTQLCHQIEHLSKNQAKLMDLCKETKANLEVNRQITPNNKMNIITMKLAMILKITT